MMLPVWINGSATGNLSPADRGLAYGDGLFETIRVVSGRAVLCNEHFSRLKNSAIALKIAIDIDKLQSRFSDFLRICPSECVAKIIITRGVGGRGYLPDPHLTATSIFSAHLPPAMPAAGLSVITAQQYIARQPLLAGHKHLNRLEQVFLRQEVADHQADEAIVCDTAGYVVEGVSTNVFGVKQGALFTPKLNQAGVKGVMRQAILAYADQIHLPVEEDHYTAEYFAAADELFFCNSVMGILPVHQWHQKKWVTGTVTQKLLDFWQSLLREQ